MGIKVCPERNRHGEPPSFATLNQTCLKPTRPNRVTPSGTWYKFAVAELHEKATRRIAGDFLRALIAAVPYRVHTVLTDNGTHFTTPGNTASAAPLIKAAI